MSDRHRRNTQKIQELMDSGAIALINLGQSGHSANQTAKDFAALLIAEYLNAALQRGDGKRQHFLLMDEAQNYLTSDAAGALDQTLKFGLHVCPIFHHFRQFQNEHLRASILEQCRIRFVFGGLDYPDAAHMAQVLFLPSINSLMVKSTRKTMLMHYEERERVAVTEAGTGRRKTKSVSFVPVKQEEQEIEMYYTRDEKVSLFAEKIQCQSPRHCIFQCAPKEGIEVETPTVPDLSDGFEDYLITLYQREAAISCEDLDNQLAAIEQSYLRFAPAQDDDDSPKPRRKKD